MPRKTKVQPSRRQRTAEQRKRDGLLLDKGYTKVDVWRAVNAAGANLSIASVRAALDHRYRNETVIRVFCELVKVPPEIAFPIDEPLYKTGKVAERARRAAAPPCGGDPSCKTHRGGAFNMTTDKECRR